GGFLEDFEAGYSKRLAVLIPPGPGWPLRGYELALLITDDARAAGFEVETTLVEPSTPLEGVGPTARTRLNEAVTEAGITVAQSDRVDVEPGVVVLEPSGERLEVERVLALPALRGRSVPGVPADEDGFVDVDDYCRVRGLDDVWAVGDGTSFPAKSG